MAVQCNVSGKNTRRFSLPASGHVSRVRLLPPEGDAWKVVVGGVIPSSDTSEVPVNS